MSGLDGSGPKHDLFLSEEEMALLSVSLVKWQSASTQEDVHLQFLFCYLGPEQDNWRTSLAKWSRFGPPAHRE